MPEFRTRRDGRRYRKRKIGVGFGAASHIARSSDIEAIAGAPEKAGSRLHRHSPPFVESDQAHEKMGKEMHCSKCREFTPYSVNGIPVCKKCWEEC